MADIRFTVFTPTYNRAHTLPRAFESLKRQTFRDFEWLIVDDGSTDNTRELIEVWQKDSSFPIRYFWQENAHKKTAFNLGVKEARGELFLPLDSDDEALPDALKILDQHWNNIPESERGKFSSVTGLCVDERGGVVDTKSMVKNGGFSVLMCYADFLFRKMFMGMFQKGSCGLPLPLISRPVLLMTRCEFITRSQIRFRNPAHRQVGQVNTQMVMPYGQVRCLIMNGAGFFIIQPGF